MLQALVPVALVLYTIPYYILAIMLVFLLAFYWPIFPVTGAYTIGAQPEPDTRLHGRRRCTTRCCPALSIVLVSLGWWFLSMRSLIVSVKGEDYITWAEAKGLPQRRIFWAMPSATRCCRKRPVSRCRSATSSAARWSPRRSSAIPGLGYLIFNSIKTLDFPSHPGQRAVDHRLRRRRQLHPRPGLSVDRSAHPLRRGREDLSHGWRRHRRRARRAIRRRDRARSAAILSGNRKFMVGRDASSWACCWHRCDWQR